VKIFKKAILPLGFQASALAGGIKKNGKLDLALLHSQVSARAAAQFTVNKIQAASVVVSKSHLKKNKIFRAIIVNSGNANCFCGKNSLADAERTVQYVAGALKTEKEKVLVASTGIIGRRLPMEKIKKAIPHLVTGLSRAGISEAKKAILTTDTFTKEITLKLNLGQKTVTICGIAKGSGMIAPNLATMLAFILTDARISRQALKKALGTSIEHSFNVITIDGCMSTNDAVFLLANGMAKNAPITSGKNFLIFQHALQIVCLELAKLLVRDAEGASKFIQIKVSGAKNFPQAKQAALAVANSNLFKTAIYGENPNFGRIAAALGASGVRLKEESLKIKVSSLQKKDIYVDVALHQGKAACTVYTSDLTCEYIKINAEYN